MFKIKPPIIFAVNILLMIISWMCYKFPHGDEYLIIFMIPLVFMVAPYTMDLTRLGFLLLINIAFFTYYCYLDALNPLDAVVLTVLLILTASASLLVRYLYVSFKLYQKKNVAAQKHKYRTMVDELEEVDRRGRKIENELNRNSRIYEITKRLAPALKFQELLEALFDFLEENFRFSATHLLTFKDGEFIKGISKTVENSSHKEKDGSSIDYEKVVDHLKRTDYNPFFAEKDEDGSLLAKMNVKAETFMAFPLFVGDKLTAILAIEGASRSSYGRFRLLVPQVAIEIRRVELYEQVQELSIIDGLTEVHLRRYLMDRLEEEVDRARRLGLTFSVGMVDVDHFKACNDKYGHLVGDAVLKKIAERLQHSVREVDMIARYGGEEFCVVLPDTTKKLALTVAERLRQSVDKEAIKAFDEEIHSTVSVGISTFPADGENVAELLEKADTALYMAKRKGRNRVCSV